MYCLDANIWVYYLDSSLPEHEAVASAVDPILEDQPVFTTTVLQMEVVHYLHRQLENSSRAIDAFLNLESITVAELTTDDVTSAVGLLEAYPDIGLGGRDRTVVAAMDRHDVTELWTYDGALKRLGDELNWLRVVHPADSEV